jgi:hypothetical protein
MKLTEDEIVNFLMDYLRQDQWKIDSHCLGHAHGCDIVASRHNTEFVIEVKGARASEDSPVRKREYFDSGQIKTHFGKAIVKILEEKYKRPKSKFAIAHPEDEDIRRVIGHLIPFLKNLGIGHFWVSENGSVVEE